MCLHVLSYVDILDTACESHKRIIKIAVSELLAKENFICTFDVLELLVFTGKVTVQLRCSWKFF